MQVDVRCYGEVRAALGGKRRTIELEEGATVEDLLSVLTAEFEAFDATDVGRAGLVASVDGRNVRHLDGGATRLEDGATVSLSGSPMAE